MLLSWTTSILTFPGVVMHELGHKLFCDWTGTRVIKVRYFRFGNPPGYVIHEHAKNLRSAFLIAIGPLLFNTFVCSGITLLAWVTERDSILFFVLLWVGISSGMRAFPSNADATSFLKEVGESRGISFFYFIAFLFASLLRLANLLRYLWFDLWYAIFVSLLLPYYFGLI
jgi:hypothetical protein